MGSALISISLFIGSILVCFLVYYICLNFFPLLTRNLDLYNQMRNNNLAVSVFTGGFVVSVTVIIYISSLQIFKLFQPFLLTGVFTGLLENLSRAFIMFTMSMFISFLVNWFAMKLFLFFSNGIDDMKELKNNNLAISFLLSSMIVAITYMVMDSIGKLNAAFMVTGETGEFGLQVAFVDLKMFLSGAVELLIMLFTSMGLFFIGLKITSFVTHGVNEFVEFKSDNVAISLIVCSSILSVMIMIKYCLYPYAVNIVEVLSDPMQNHLLFLAVIRYFYILIISTIISILVLWLSMGLFLFLTRMFDSMNEIKKRNVATAVILSVFTFSASFIMRSGVNELLKVLLFF